jgi:ribonuclease P protein component
MTADARFPTECHIRRSAEFDRAYRRRAAASDDVLLVFGCENQLTHARLGLSVSRKVGGAVQRNRWKRRLREAFRLSRSQLPTGIDLVVVPKAAVEPPFAELMKSLVRLAQRATRRLAANPPRDTQP